MKTFQLAQMNIARLLAPLDSPQLQDFVDNLDRVNALADGSPGFVWRLQTPAGDATTLRPLGDDVIINMSVWVDVEALNQFVYRSEHVQIMRRRREWFERMIESHLVMWWVPRGHMPTVEEGIERLNHLRQHGPSAYAFNVRKAFPPPDQADESVIPSSWADCPA